MAVIGGLLPLIAGGVATTVAGALLAPKPPKINQTPRVVERQPSAVSDALQSRRGSRVNQRTGGLGAEAGAGTKTKLGA